MDSPQRISPWFLMAAAVPLSSLTGLARAMVEGDGLTSFVDVWKANLWADLIFTGGTMAATAAVLRLVAGAHALAPGDAGRTLRALGAVAASLLLTWAVYAFSASLMMPSLFNGEFLGTDFRMFGDGGNAWTFTWEWGGIGIVFMGLATPAAAWLSRAAWPQVAPPRAPTP